MYVQYTVGESCVETKTEADSGDFNECPPYDVQSSGMFAFSNTTLCGNLPRAGSGVARIDPLRFLGGCRTRRLNQV